MGGCYSCVVLTRDHPASEDSRSAALHGSASDSPGAPANRGSGPSGYHGEAGEAHFVRSCIDGPVFDARRIVWEALTH